MNDVTARAGVERDPMSTFDVRGLARWSQAAMLTAVIGFQPLAAQIEPATGAEPPRVGCFRGRPLPACKSFWITEMLGETPLAQTTYRVQSGGYAYPIESFEDQLEWNLGHMVNVSERYAVGGLLSAGTAGGSTLSGVKARGRRWLSEGLSLEVDAGLLRQDSYPSAANGVTLAARLNIRDQGAFYIRWDGIGLPENPYPIPGSYDPGGFQQAFSVGAGLGSIPALVGTGALGLGVLLLFLAWADEWD
jgi:hypothetical protein